LVRGGGGNRPNFPDRTAGTSTQLDLLTPIPCNTRIVDAGLAVLVYTPAPLRLWGVGVVHVRSFVEEARHSSQRRMHRLVASAIRASNISTAVKSNQGLTRAQVNEILEECVTETLRESVT